MNGSKESGVQPRKLLAGGAVKIRIALASTLVLAVGAWLGPRAAQTGLSAPQEHAAPLLEEQAQLREVSRPFVGVQEVAAPIRQHSVAILLPASPAMPSRNDFSEPVANRRSVAGFGVFVSDTHVLTHSAALNGRSTVDVSVGSGVTTSAPVVTYEPSTGLVLLQVQPSEARAPVTLASDAPAPGALAVAVGRSDDREMAAPVFVTSVGREEYRLARSTMAFCLECRSSLLLANCLQSPRRTAEKSEPFLYGKQQNACWLAPRLVSDVRRLASGFRSRVDA